MLIRALIVEDNLANQKLLRKILETLNFEIQCVSTGEECWSMIKNGALFDVIFLDMHLPKMDGFELAKKIRSILGDEVKIIGVTALAMSGDREKVLEAGCDDYIAKPIFLNELKEILKKHFKEL